MECVSPSRGGLHKTQPSSPLPELFDLGGCVFFPRAPFTMAQLFKDESEGARRSVPGSRTRCAGERGCAMAYDVWSGRLLARRRILSLKAGKGNAIMQDTHRHATITYSLSHALNHTQPPLYPLLRPENKRTAMLCPPTIHNTPKGVHETSPATQASLPHSP